MLKTPSPRGNKLTMDIPTTQKSVHGALLNTIIRGETSISANQLAMTFTTSRPYTSLTKRASWMEHRKMTWAEYFLGSGAWSALSRYTEWFHTNARTTLLFTTSKSLTHEIDPSWEFERPHNMAIESFSSKMDTRELADIIYIVNDLPCLCMPICLSSSAHLCM